MKGIFWFEILDFKFLVLTAPYYNPHPVPFINFLEFSNKGKK